MLVYLDASAITKLVIHEPESTALRRTLSEARPRAATSVVSEIETRRALHRTGPTAKQAEHLERTLQALHMIELSRAIRERAGALQPVELRSLDAAHLASALSLGDELDSFVCYDARLGAAATACGLSVLTPL